MSMSESQSIEVCSSTHDHKGEQSVRRRITDRQTNNMDAEVTIIGSIDLFKFILSNTFQSIANQEHGAHNIIPIVRFT